MPHRIRALLIVLLPSLLSSNCGISSSSQPLQLTVSELSCSAADNPPSSVTYAWTLDGFTEGQLENPTSRDGFVGRLSVGDTVNLSLSNYAGKDCSSLLAAVNWVSTSPDVAALTPDGTAQHAVLKALTEGQTIVFADITFKSGRTFHALPFAFGSVTSGLISSVHVIPR